jgi:ADP-ribose pyrophosphatase
MEPIQPSAGRSIATLSSREVYRNHWMRCARTRFCAPTAKRASTAWSKRTTRPSSCPSTGAGLAGGAVPLRIQERALELPQGGWEMEIDNPEELARGELKEELGPGRRPA